MIIGRHFKRTITVSASLLVLQGRKYVKRSELERVQVPSGEGEQGGVVSEESGKQAAGSSLLSPTSVTSPVEESPIFSIPKAEVCVCVCVCVCGWEGVGEEEGLVQLCEE